jgi:hypothetical protein
MQQSDTRKMLGSSWVTTTIVMPRSRLRVRMRWSSSTAEIGSSPADGLVEEQQIGFQHQGTGNAGSLFHPARYEQQSANRS